MSSNLPPSVTGDEVTVSGEREFQNRLQDIRLRVVTAESQDICHRDRAWLAEELAQAREMLAAVCGDPNARPFTYEHGARAQQAVDVHELERWYDAKEAEFHEESGPRLDKYQLGYLAGLDKAAQVIRGGLIAPRRD
jgi:hypothetical protein